MDLNPEHVAGEVVEGVGQGLDVLGDLLSKMSGEVEKFAALVEKMGEKLEAS